MGKHEIRTTSSSRNVTVKILLTRGRCLHTVLSGLNLQRGSDSTMTINVLINTRAQKNVAHALANLHILSIDCKS